MLSIVIHIIHYNKYVPSYPLNKNETTRVSLESQQSIQSFVIDVTVYKIDECVFLAELQETKNLVGSFFSAFATRGRMGVTWNKIIQTNTYRLNK